MSDYNDFKQIVLNINDASLASMKRKLESDASIARTRLEIVDDEVQRRVKRRQAICTHQVKNDPTWQFGDPCPDCGAWGY